MKRKLKLKANRPNADNGSADKCLKISTRNHLAIDTYLQLDIYIGLFLIKRKKALAPIFEGNDVNNFKDCRPVSILTSFPTILEKFMYISLVNFVKSGIYQNNNSELEKVAQHTMLYLNWGWEWLGGKITKAIDQWKYTVGVFLDLFIASDSIYHEAGLGN